MPLTTWFGSSISSLACLVSSQSLPALEMEVFGAWDHFERFMEQFSKGVRAVLAIRLGSDAYGLDACVARVI